MPPSSSIPKPRILQRTRTGRVRTPSSQKAANLQDTIPSTSPIPIQTTRKPPLSSFFSRLFPFSLQNAPPFIRRTLRVLRILAPIVPIGIFFSENVAQVMWVRGPSMMPCLNEEYGQTNTESDMVFVNLFPFKAGLRAVGKKRTRLERGMIVTFRSPANPSHIAIKRIIGLPGDRITTRDPCPKPTQIVPFNHVWVEGDADDPKKSLDSNTYGPVSVNLLTGRVEAVLWPRMKWLRWEDWEDGVAEDGASSRSSYREDVRRRVLKGAVQLQPPPL